MTSSALFAILQLDRGYPNGYGNALGLLQAWLQDAGGFAAVGLVVYLVYALATPTDKSESERLRVPVSNRMVLMAGLALVCYALVLALLVMGKPDITLGGKKVFLLQPAVPQPPPGAPVKVEPPQWHGQALPVLLMIGGMFALIGIGEPFVRDMFKMRWRRIMALSKVAYKEAVRFRVHWLFFIIMLPFLFKSVWLSGRAADEFRKLIGVATFFTMLLVLITAVLLSSFSLPTDIKNQTIHTVVTKPVERFEIVLGRFFGYVYLMTLGLAGMTALCLVLVNFTTINEKAKQETVKARVPVRGKLEFKASEKRKDFDGTNVGREFDYRKYIGGHELSNERAVWHFRSIPSAMTRAARDRVPVEFTFDIFRMTKGDENKGVSVAFRFVAHNCPQKPPEPGQAPGIWQWADGEGKEQYDAAVRGLGGDGQRGYLISPAQLARRDALAKKAEAQAASESERKERDALVRLVARMKSLADRLRKVGVEVSAEGEALWTKPVNVEAIRPDSPNWPVANAVAEEFGFYEIRGMDVYDYAVMSVDVPAGLLRGAAQGDPGKDDKGNTKPRFSVYVKCESGGQLLGMAEPDLYILEDVKSFSQNFIKAMFGLWCKLCIVVALAVACSTYLSGVLSLLATVVIFNLGFLSDHMNDLATNRNIGGGPFESMSRLVKAEAPTAPTSDSAGIRVIHILDQFWAWTVRRIQNVVPDVESLSWSHFLSEGYNVNTEFLLVNLMVTLGYLLPWGVLAYYLLKSREVAN